MGHHGDETVLVLLGLPLLGVVLEDHDRPGVLLAHEMRGDDDLEHPRADLLAKLSKRVDPRLEGQHLVDGFQRLGPEAQIPHGQLGAVLNGQKQLGLGVHQHRLAGDIQHDHPLVHGVDQLPGKGALVVELGEIGLPFADQDPLPRGPLHDFHEVLGGERLDQEVECPMSGNLHRSLDGGKGRDDHDHGVVPRSVVDETGHLEAVDPGHLEVHQRQVVPGLLEESDRRLSVLRQVDFETSALQDPAHAFAHALLVIDHDDPQAFFHRRGS